LSLGNKEYNMKLSHLFVILLLSQAGWSYAEIYKRVDADGHVTYSSEPLKGGKKIYLKPLPTASGGKRESNRSTPEDFPRVDTQTQKRRDNTRRVILDDELASEEKLLDTAHQNLKSIEATPAPPIVGADGIPFRNAAKYADKLKAAQSEVSLHEQNISALKTEISNLK
jgi:hypothetical protein